MVKKRSRQSYVVVKGEDVPVSKVKVLDIEEDFTGRDLLTFEYKGEVKQSYIKHGN